MSDRKKTIIFLIGLVVFIVPIMWVSTRTKMTVVSEISPCVSSDIKSLNDFRSGNTAHSIPCPFVHTIVYKLFADETPLLFEKIADVTSYSTNVLNVTIIENTKESFWNIFVTLSPGKEKATVYIPARKPKTKHASLLRINVDLLESGMGIVIPIKSSKDFSITRIQPLSTSKN